MFGGDDLPKIHDRPSILSFIRGRMDADGCLPDPSCALPNTKPAAPDEITWTAGALDGVVGHHGSVGDAAEAGRDLARAMVAAAGRSRRRHLTALYDRLVTDDVLSFLDPTIEALAELRPPVADIARLGTWLASESPDRGPVKVGMALLGVTGAPDGSLLHQLGAHEELTLFAAVAFTNARADPEPDLVALARRVHGWGRIQCVERLRGTTNPEIARWILTEGFRNQIMYEYLAHLAATTGDLAGALAEPSPGPEVLAAATDLIDALITGGPAQDIDDYDDAPVALSRWLGHVEHGTGTLPELLTIDAIRRFCESGGWDERLARGTWTAAARDDLRATAARLLDRPQWVALARAGLDSDDPQVFWRAVRAARLVGLDPFAALLARIEADPLDGPWHQAWQDVDRDRAEVLVELARRVLDLDAIATGPTTALGLGPTFRPHWALGATLQGLRKHPGLGDDLVAVAMHSPSVPNRNGALDVLEAAGPERWSAAHRRQLEVLAASDPQERVRQRAADLLAGGEAP